MHDASSSRKARHDNVYHLRDCTMTQGDLRNEHGHLNRDDVPGEIKLEEGGLTELRGYAEIIHCKSASRRCISLWIAGSDMDNAVAFAICRQR